MENKSFDHIIKNKLDQFSLEIEADAWDLFQERQANADFDSIINDGVKDHEIAVDADAWQLFQASEANALFDEIVNEDLKDYDSNEVPTDFAELADKIPMGFDELIGSKLAAHSMDVDADWDEFEKILDEDPVFDKQVSEAVETYEAPVSESQWPKLAEHLEKVEKRRRRIVITKFIEAAVFLLFILTLMHLYPIQNITKQNVFRTIGVVEDLNYNNRVERDRGEDISEATLVSEESQRPEITEVIEPLAFTTLSSTVSGEPRSKVYRQKRTTSILPPLELKIESNSVGNKNNELFAFFGEESKQSFSQDIIDLEQSSLGEQELLATLDIKDLEYIKRDFNYPINDISSLVKKDQYWFNVYGSPEINLINTPYDRSYSDDRFLEDDEVDAYAHAAHGYSIGASISKETANFEVESGIEYTSLNYNPKAVYEVTGNATTGLTTRLLKEIIFDIVEFPVNLKYTIFRKKGWKVYGNNGISAGMVAFANYDIDEKIGRPLASAEVSRGPSRVEESFVDRKKFDRGFFNTGSISDNIFATVNVGFGVSKEISDQISFYVQPTYYHNLSQSGIGPNNDVHHRMSLQIGTKVRI